MGQGSTGQARRFGNDDAQHIIRQTLLFGGSDLLNSDLLNSDLLNEDNRYFASGLTHKDRACASTVHLLHAAMTASGASITGVSAPSLRRRSFHGNGGRTARAAHTMRT